MSKQSEAKEKQGFRKTGNMCSNCNNYTSVRVRKEYTGYGGKQVWYEEREKRCLLGGFAVGKSNVCNHYEIKNEETLT